MNMNSRVWRVQLLRSLRLSLMFLSVSLFFSCSDKPPIREGDFVEIYVQLQLTDAQYSAQPSVQKAKVDSLLKAFNVNDSLVNSTLSWYSRKPERWQKFFGDVQNRMSGIKAAYLREKH